MLQHDAPPKHYAQQKRSDMKDHVVYDSFYMKCPAKAHLQRQNVDEWLPRAGGQELEQADGK